MLARLTGSQSLRTLQYRQGWTVIGLLAIAVGVCYLPALRVGFLSDDFVLLSQSEQQRFGTSLVAIDPTWIFYRPLGKILWWSIFRVWGDQAVMYHFVSISLHWINSVLVWQLVRRLVPNVPTIPLVTAVLWAVYPLNVEAVVWLASQYDLLATCWYLATLLLLVHWWQHGQRRVLVASLATYQLALWSKELAFTMPALMVIIGLALPKRPSVRILALSVAAYALLLAINLIQRYIVWGSIGGYSITTPTTLHIIWMRLGTTLWVLLAPLNQFVFGQIMVWVWVLLLTVVIVLGILAHPSVRLGIVALAWLIVTTLPIFSILPISADLQNSRVLYLPGIGFCLGLAVLLDALARRAYRYGRMAFTLGVTLLALVYIATLSSQLQPWVIAGREARRIVQTIGQILPKLDGNDLVQIAGAPDNYNGAYMFRLGLDTALHQYTGTLFHVEQVAQLPPLPQAAADQQVFQLAFALNDATSQWQVVEARSQSIAKP